MPIAEIARCWSVCSSFFGAGIYIGAALGVLGAARGLHVLRPAVLDFIGQRSGAPSSSFVLVAVPLFLLMGEILLRAGLSERLYRALNVWLDRLPGGLLHTNIVACGVFSAISGSSRRDRRDDGLGRAALFRGTSYDPRMVLGSLAAGGALGNLIPPGITFIVYGADHRDLGRRALYRGDRAERPGGALFIAVIISSTACATPRRWRRRRVPLRRRSCKRASSISCRPRC